MSSKLKLSLLSIVICTGLILVTSQTAHATWLIDRSGAMIKVSDDVLGTETTSEVENELNEPSRVESEDGEIATQEQLDLSAEKKLKELELKREKAKKQLEIEVQARKKTQEMKREKTQSSIEIDGQSLRVKQTVENQAKKVVRQQVQELKAGETLVIDQGDDSKLELSPSVGGEIELKGEQTRTRTHFPMTIGENNALIITKKDGTQKTVTYLPDAAVAKLAQKGFVTTDLTTDLEEDPSGTAVYKFQTEKEKKLFGLFRTKFKEQTTVSAENGEIISTLSTEPSPFKKFLSHFAK